MASFKEVAGTERTLRKSLSFLRRKENVQFYVKGGSLS